MLQPNSYGTDGKIVLSLTQVQKEDQSTWKLGVEIGSLDQSMELILEPPCALDQDLRPIDWSF